MPTRSLVRHSFYQDSVALMRLATGLLALDGVRQASAVMGTETNKAVLEEAGLLTAEAASARPNDLVLMIEADSEAACEGAAAEAERLITQPAAPSGRTDERRPRTMAAGLERAPDADLLIVSTPGPYAGAEALKGLKSGLHVFLFSDNVPLEQEIALKQEAQRRDLLLMGPDCGTAIIGGAAIGFANLVRAGPIGVVGPSGTGIQQITVLLDRYGSGVSQAIGTGSHDLSDEIGGVTTIQALDALAGNASTEVIVIVAKPSSPAVAQRVLDRCQALGKQVVVNFLGLDPEDVDANGVTLARTIDEAAVLAVAAAGGDSVAADISDVDLDGLAQKARSGLAPGQRFIRGLFSGGTLCAEALVVLGDLGLVASSNLSLAPHRRLVDLNTSRDHTCIDLGADELTVGRPHPMIDFRARLDRLAQEARDPSVAVILLDVVLGYGAHPDPATELGPAIERALDDARRDGRGLAVIGSVCGTERDPQGLAAQEERLREAGMHLLPSNAAAARFAGMIVGAGEATPLGPPAGGGKGKNSPLPASGEQVRGAALARATGRRGVAVSPAPIQALLAGPIRAANVGIQQFADLLTQQGVAAMHVDWRPPGQGDPELAWALAKLTGDRGDPEAPGNLIDRANEEAIERLLAAQPMLVDLVKAREVWPDMGRRLLHAGPPIAWERMCGPMRGAIIGAALFEGWAHDEADARTLLDRSEIDLAPCHHFDAVGPMAGIISPSMSIWVVRNAVHGNVAYSNLNEGLGKVLRFGAYGPEVIERLHWMEDVLAPTLRKTLASLGGGLDLKAILAQALQMGDDGHNRNLAGTSLLFRQLSLPLLKAEPDTARAREALTFVDGNNHFFLNLSMAAAKAMLQAAHRVPHSSLVTTMARNGVEFGIRVSGLGDRWFTAPAPIPDGLYFPGYSETDANPDMGDSAITETAGWGGFAMGTAPAMVQFVGGAAEDALGYTREMMEITLARNSGLALPALGFTGTPTGIDLRRVLDTGIQPLINTGIAHMNPGIGQVGAGIVRAPMACFEAALLALAEPPLRRRAEDGPPLRRRAEDGPPLRRRAEDGPLSKRRAEDGPRT